MLTVVSMFVFAQTIALPNISPLPPAPVSRQVLQPHQDIRALPGELDDVPVLNSNSPEVIQKEGILVSTFPPDEMAVPSAHLDYSLDGAFDIFAHHVAKGVTPDDARTMYLGILLRNPGNETVTLDVENAATYLSQQAPFYDLPSYIANPHGEIYAGPGSRTMNDILRNVRQPQWSPQIEIPPQSTYLLANVPIPLRQLTVAVDGSLLPGRLLLPPLNNLTLASAASLSSSESGTSLLLPDDRPIPLNGRSLLMHLKSDAPLYAASLAMYAPTTDDGNERVPRLQEWEDLLENGELAGPRDRSPTPPDSTFYTRFFYGRVAGVAKGSEWIATLTDSEDSDDLTVPEVGQRISYVISTVDHNTFGTDQIQSAPMLARYPDTAYRSHGNYGVRYDLTMPLYNPTEDPRTVAILMQTPFQNELVEDALIFADPPESQVFFRGTVRLRYKDEFRVSQTRYVHVVQHRGEQGEPLIRVRIPPGSHRQVQIDFLYPPDATPPQVLTVQTLE